MIALLLIALYVGIVWWRFSHRKTSLEYIIFLSIFSPYVNIGSKSYDSLYFVIPLLLIGIVIRNKGQLKKPRDAWFKKYAYMSLAVSAIYLFAWIIFSRQDVGTAISCILGILKYVLLFYLAYSLKKSCLFSENNAGIKPESGLLLDYILKDASVICHF